MSHQCGLRAARMPEQSAKRNQVHGLQPLDEHAYDDSLRPATRPRRGACSVRCWCHCPCERIAMALAAWV
jgi:hypothetical protein